MLVVSVAPQGGFTPILALLTCRGVSDDSRGFFSAPPEEQEALSPSPLRWSLIKGMGLLAKGNVHHCQWLIFKSLCVGQEV